MPLTVHIGIHHLQHLDLSPADGAIALLKDPSQFLAQEQQLQFQIDYPQSADDPRELSEIPEVRLWFLRLDARYPWLPFLLDWQHGELARYVAMLVPHQFNPAEGIQYNPEALEIFLMHKVFILLDWFEHQGIPGTARLKAMAQMLGYDLEDSFFDGLQQQSP